MTVTGATMTARTIAIKASDGAGTEDTITVAKVTDGAAGADGLDAYTVVLTNESHTFPGSETAANNASATTDVLAYKGSTRVPATINSVTGAPTGMSTSIANNGTLTARLTVAVDPTLVAPSGKLTLNLTVDGKTFTKDFSWAVAYKGTTGAPGPTIYTWVKYADSPTSGMSDLPAGKAYIGLAFNKTTATKSTVYGDYTWSLIKGTDGIPGEPGADGQTTYTWLKYADSPTTGMSDSPGGKAYIGIAVNKTTPTESTNYGDYTWSLIKGADGTNGSNGVGIISVTPYYRQTATGASTPAKPTVSPPASPWTSTEPAYAPDTELWRTERIEYTNGTVEYTLVSKVSSYTAAAAARTLAITADNRVNVSTAEPTTGDATGRPTGALWWRFQGTELVGLWRLTNTGTWEPLPLSRTLIPQIDIGAGTFGNLDGARMAARTVVAGSLAVGDESNLVPNGTGDWGVKGGWLTHANLTFEGTDKPTAIAGVVKGPASTFSAPGESLASAGWQCEEGEQFYIEMWVKASKANSRMYVELKDQNDANAVSVANPNDGSLYAGNAANPMSNLTVPTTWTKYVSLATALPGVRKMRVSKIEFNHTNGSERTAVQSIAIRVRRRNKSVLIEDGAVLARHVGAQQIEGNHVKANAIETNHLKTGLITAEKMALGVMRSNLLPDGSLEDDYTLTPWDPFGTWAGVGGTYGNMDQWRYGNPTNGSTITRDLTGQRARSGRGAVLLTATSNSTAEATLLSPSVPIQVGKTYRLLVHAACLNGQGLLAVQAHSNSSQGITSFEGSQSLTADDVTGSSFVSPPIVDDPINPDSFRTFGWTFTATNTWVQFRLINFRPGVASTVVIDDVSLVEVGLGGASELTSAGLRLFDDEGYEAGAFVTNRPNYFSVSSGGDAVAELSSSGDFSANSVSVKGDFYVAGSPVLGELMNFVPAGAENAGDAWLDKMPRGLVGYGSTALTTLNSNTGLFEVMWKAEPGRTYQFVFAGIMARIANPDRPAWFQFRNTTPAYTADGTGEAATPTLSNGAILAYSSATRTLSTDTYQMFPARSAFMRCNRLGTSAGGEVNAGWNRLLVTYNPNSSGEFLATTSDNVVQVAVLDIGPDSPNEAAANTGGGTGVTTKKSYTSVWKLNQSRTYNGNTNTHATHITDMVHGPVPGYSNNRYAIAFSSGNAISGETGKTMGSAFTGATIKRVEVKLTATHWYYGAGGKLYIRPFNSAAFPTTGNPGASGSAKVFDPFKKETRWVDITSLTNSKLTSLRGILIGATGTTDLKTYGRFATNAEIRVSYER